MLKYARGLRLAMCAFLWVMFFHGDAARADSCSFWIDDPNNGCYCYTNAYTRSYGVQGVLEQQYHFGGITDNAVATPSACASALNTETENWMYQLCYYNPNAITVEADPASWYWQGSFQGYQNKHGVRCCIDYGLNCS